MKSRHNTRHNTRQNRPIVNVADGTSDASQSTTHACAVSTHRAANNGRGMTNASRSIMGKWCNTAILTIFTAGYGTVAADGFKSLKIRG